MIVMHGKTHMYSLFLGLLDLGPRVHYSSGSEFELAGHSLGPVNRPKPPKGNSVLSHDRAIQSWKFSKFERAANEDDLPERLSLTFPCIQMASFPIEAPNRTRFMLRGAQLFLSSCWSHMSVSHHPRQQVKIAEPETARAGRRLRGTRHQLTPTVAGPHAQASEPFEAKQPLTRRCIRPVHHPDCAVGHHHAVSPEPDGG